MRRANLDRSTGSVQYSVVVRRASALLSLRCVPRQVDILTAACGAARAWQRLPSCGRVSARPVDSTTGEDDDVIVLGVYMGVSELDHNSAPAPEASNAYRGSHRRQRGYRDLPTA